MAAQMKSALASLGLALAVLAVAAASWMLTKCAYAWGFGTEQPELWIGVAAFASTTVLVGIAAMLRIDPSTRHFLPSLAFVPLAMVGTGATLSALPATEAVRSVVVHGLVAILLGLAWRDLRVWLRARPSPSVGSGA